MAATASGGDSILHFAFFTLHFALGGFAAWIECKLKNAKCKVKNGLRLLWLVIVPHPQADLLLVFVEELELWARAVEIVEADAEQPSDRVAPGPARLRREDAAEVAFLLQQ